MEKKSVEQKFPIEPTKVTFSDAELDSVYYHYKKLLGFGPLIIGGSYALKIYGLTDKVHDLDLEIEDISTESEALLRKLEIPVKEGYPPRKHIRVEHPLAGKKLIVDFFLVRDTNYLELADGRKVSKIGRIIEAKRGFPGLKQLLQRKKLSEMFYKPGEGREFLDREQNKY
jgi:hypothetical protein